MILGSIDTLACIQRLAKADEQKPFIIMKYVAYNRVAYQLVDASSFKSPDLSTFGHMNHKLGVSMAANRQTYKSLCVPFGVYSLSESLGEKNNSNKIPQAG